MTDMRNGRQFLRFVFLEKVSYNFSILVRGGYRMHRFAFCLLFVFSLVAVLPGAAAPRVSSEQQERVYTLGAIAYSGSQNLKSGQMLADYLGARLKAKVQIKMYNEYAGILNDIDHEMLDMAILSPVVYALCMDDPGLSFVATALFRGKPVYHSVILARKDGPIASIQGLSGKKIGFVDRYSASGYIYPAAFLRTANLMDGDIPLYNPIFYGSHDRVIRALFDGKVDAIATYDTFFEYANHQVGEMKNLSLDSFRVLKLVPERIPEDAFVCRSEVGKDVIDTLKIALSDFESEKKAPNSAVKEVSYSGFKPGNQKAYEEVKSFLQDIIEGEKK